MKILITGGSGLVGTALTEKLIEKGYKVNWISRSNKSRKDVDVYQWDLKKAYIDKEAFKGVDAIVHLSGANISANRWSETYKKLIADSRIETSQLLFDSVTKYNIPLKTFISASAIGYYGTFTSDKVLTEDSPPGNDFLAKVCIEWEKKAKQFQTIGARTATIRTGVVLSNKGGALPQITKPIKWGVGANLGNGQQYMPWIHIDDLVNIYLKCIENSSMHGTYNATSPDSITNKKITKQLAKYLNRPLWLPNIPKSILKLILGERANLLLEGTRIFPKRLLNQKFSFKYSSFAEAIVSLF
ncbi:hypothetical protein C7377_1405 [Balneicella halophila]|uniref:TIGR01777 family protein n=1 Tax=Balneicella halophila TaxID=1537566 RepID=A0A7L4UR44_BALHA|nr:TIGR01777 family oxidoreductase [Balneicella halophila]PVX51072.1 hypothetical protein C7377_1405 [Balneicella halophila]